MNFAKRMLGQFFTTNSDRILSGMEKLVAWKHVVDPFAWAGDLMKWAAKHGAAAVRGYDVDPSKASDTPFHVSVRDSLRSPAPYAGKFVVTNPPYLNKNKAKGSAKESFSGHVSDDLYQIAVSTLSDADGGILVVPINFLSADNAAESRKIFFRNFRITAANYFTEAVFDDTGYSVVAFSFERLGKPETSCRFTMNILPEGKRVELELESRFGWMAGGSFVSAVLSTPDYLGTARVCEKDFLKPGSKDSVLLNYNDFKTERWFEVPDRSFREMESSILVLKSIDAGKGGEKLGLFDIRNETDHMGLVGKETSRHIAHVVFRKKAPTVKEQEAIIARFNAEMSEARKKYASLFLTNFRENDRKRVSFEFAYGLINRAYASVSGTH